MDLGQCLSIVRFFQFRFFSDDGFQVMSWYQFRVIIREFLGGRVFFFQGSICKWLQVFFRDLGIFGDRVVGFFLGDLVFFFVKGFGFMNGFQFGIWVRGFKFFTTGGGGGRFVSFMVFFSYVFQVIFLKLFVCFIFWDFVCDRLFRVC